MSQCCPTCGQRLVDDGELRIDPAGFVVRAGRFAALTKLEMALLLLLKQRPGALVSRMRIERELWPNEADAPESSVNQAEVHLSRLRRKLRPLGLIIESAVRGVGAYRLVIETVKAEAA